MSEFPGPDLPIRIAGIVHDSIVDGPGLRTTVFVQGCPLKCMGCHNPSTWDAAGGRCSSTHALMREIAANPVITGLTLSGGEPSRQPAACAQLARFAHERGLNVWCYSGFRVEALLREAQHSSALAELLHEVDVLVDGPFQIARRSLEIPWRGSTNQRLIDMPATLNAHEAVPFGSG